MKKFIVTIISFSLLNSCNLFEEKRLTGTVAEYNGKAITIEELQMLTMGLSSEDSSRLASQYVRQWAMDLIEYDVAKDQTNKNIEKLVEDYRRSLYIHEYEEKLIAQRMSRVVEDTLVYSFYNLHRENLPLDETILQGVFLVVPHDAPNMNELRKKIQLIDIEENIEWLEKFAYQYAVGYELFLEEWKSINEIIVHMPFKQDNLNKQLRTQRQVEVSDSISTYILQVTNIHFQGELQPLTYARKEIENILLHQRQVEFLQKERELLYKKAIKEGKLKLYEE